MTESVTGRETVVCVSGKTLSWSAIRIPALGILLRKLIGDVPTATAILDRILHRAEIIQITGKSYRLKDRACQKEKKKS